MNVDRNCASAYGARPERDPKYSPRAQAKTRRRSSSKRRTLRPEQFEDIEDSQREVDYTTPFRAMSVLPPAVLMHAHHLNVEIKRSSAPSKGRI